MKPVRKPETMNAELDASDWRTIVNHWDLYHAAGMVRGDQRWRDAMPGLVGYVRRRCESASGPIIVPGTHIGYVYVTQWAASMTMGTAPDLHDVMTRLVPQISAADPDGRRSTAEVDQ